MKLKVLDIPEEGLDFDFTAQETPWLQTLIQNIFPKEYKKGQKAEIVLNILKTCNNVSLVGDATIGLKPTCDRCLEPFEKKMHVPLQMNLVPYKGMNFENSQDKTTVDEDENFSFYKGEEVNLSEIIREMLLLEIPIRTLCKENCKGLCPQCGQNLNLKKCSCNPQQSPSQFEVLKKLVKK